MFLGLILFNAIYISAKSSYYTVGPSARDGLCKILIYILKHDNFRLWV